MSAATSENLTSNVRNVPVRAHGCVWLLFLALTLAGLTPRTCFADGPAVRSLIDKRAPEFARLALDGSKIDLQALRGKVILLNFWATWCAPCQVEMPVFASWRQQYGRDGLQVIGISMDDDPAPARKLVSRLNLDYPIAMGDAKLGERYGGVLGLPLTFLIDKNGIVRAEFQGETEPKIIEKRLKEMLSRK